MVFHKMAMDISVALNYWYLATTSKQPEVLRDRGRERLRLLRIKHAKYADEFEIIVAKQEAKRGIKT